MESKEEMVIVQYDQESQLVYCNLTDKQIEQLMIKLSEMKLSGEHFSWGDHSNKDSRIVIYFRKVSISENGTIKLDQEGSKKIYSSSFFSDIIIIFALVGVTAVIYMLFKAFY